MTDAKQRVKDYKEKKIFQALDVLENNNYNDVREYLGIKEGNRHNYLNGQGMSLEKALVIIEGARDHFGYKGAGVGH